MSSAYAPLQPIDHAILAKADVTLSVLRLDLFNTFSSVGSAGAGNKYFKLKLNIEQAVNKGFKSILSFGGAYSNHIYALALAGKHFNIPTIGIIRGEATASLNPTLTDAVAAGMALEFVPREVYRQKHMPDYIASLEQKYPGCYVLPEGGSNKLAVDGCKEIADHISHNIGENYDVVALACGTGGTMAGLVAGLPADKTVMGFSVLKGAFGLDNDVKNFLTTSSAGPVCGWHIEHNYHGGGYARLSPALIDFMDEFLQTSGIVLDAVYTAKACYGLFQKIAQGDFERSSKIVFIHTGGLQGNRGMANIYRKDGVLNG